MARILTKDLMAGFLSLALLGGAAWDKHSVLPTKDPAPFHAHVRDVAEQMPLHVGNWVAKEVGERGTKEYLHANVMIDRQFTNTVTGQQVGFLFTQCPDIRDLVPHFPAICYPGRGMIQVEVKPHDWMVDGLKITGSEYEFESDSFRTANGLTVDNFMLLPGGTISRDMTEVKAHVPLRNRYYGVGQVQVVFSVGMANAQREAIFKEIVAAHRPLIDAILAGKVE